jgi:hypothetical protein
MFAGEVSRDNSRCYETDRADLHFADRVKGAVR